MKENSRVSLWIRGHSKLSSEFFLAKTMKQDLVFKKKMGERAEEIVYQLRAPTLISNNPV